MVEPLTREERTEWICWGVMPARIYDLVLRYEATVEAAEKRSERMRNALEAALPAVEALALDGVVVRRPEWWPTVQAVRAAIAADDAARGDS